MIEITNKGEVVGRSRNLRGVMANHRRRHTFLARYGIRPIADGKGLLTMAWANGNEATVEFADFQVLEHFVKQHPAVFY